MDKKPNKKGARRRTLRIVENTGSAREPDIAVTSRSEFRGLSVGDQSLEVIIQELEAILKGIDYGVMFMGPDLRTRIINPAFRRMWSISDEFAASHPSFFDMIEHIRGLGLYDVPAADWAAFVEQRHSELLEATGEPRESKRSDGVTLLYSCVPLPDGGRMLTYFDISEQKETEAALQQTKNDLQQRVGELEKLQKRLSEQRNQAIRSAELLGESHDLLSEVVDSVSEAIALWDEDGQLIVANRRLRGIFPDLADILIPGVAFETFLRVGFERGVLVDNDSDRAGEGVKARMMRHQHSDTVSETRLGDGRWIRIQRRRTKHGRRVATIVDITAEKEREAKIRLQAARDPLTGLANRREFNARLGTAIDEANATGRPVGLFLIDLDKFKPINDEYGHPAGDAVLKEVAIRLQGCMRRSDLAARIGGDEFAAIVTEVDDQNVLETLADRIVVALAQPVELGGLTLRCGASVGVALWPEDANSPEKLIDHADSALYEAKQAGRNTWRLHDHGRRAC